MENQIVELKIGNDNGNSEHDIIINEELIAEPNVFAKVRELPLLDDVNVGHCINKLEDNLIVTINSPSVTPGIYYIGNYALKSGKRLHNMEVGVFNDKANSDVVIINTLAQIAGKATKEAYKTNKNLDKQIIAKAEMTTALPVTQYNNESSNIMFERFMNKKHNVIVHVGNIRVDVDIYFEFIKVLPESIPVIFALQKKKIVKKEESELTIEEKFQNAKIVDMFKEFNETYKMDIDGEYFKDKKILHIAIGEGTTEYPITNGIAFNPEFIRGSDNGVGHAIENALPNFKNSVGLRTFTRQNYSSILRNKDHKYYSACMDYVEEHLEAESEDILHYAKLEIEKANNDIDIICVHGGGSILMKDFLYKKLLTLGKKADIKLFYVTEKYAVTLEAWGMYEFTNNTIFKKLKNKLLNSKGE